MKRWVFMICKIKFLRHFRASIRFGLAIFGLAIFVIQSQYPRYVLLYVIMHIVISHYYETLLGVNDGRLDLVVNQNFKTVLKR